MLRCEVFKWNIDAFIRVWKGSNRCGVNQQFALFFGGTTLLIMVGVALDTLQVIESYLLTKKYDGLIKSGRIQGRSSSGIQVGQPQ